MTESRHGTLIALIGAYPGLHLRELARQGGLSEALAGYHVRRMLDAGVVEAHMDGNHLRLFATAGKGLRDEDRRVLAMMRQRLPLAIILHLLEVRSATHGTMAERLGIAKSTLSYHVAKLTEAGIIVQDGDGRTLRLRDAAHVAVLGQRWRPPSALVDSFAASWSGLYRPRGRRGVAP
ncbi:MAG: winged helix-turn-helix transcriptional regulator [bacterium]